jgi:hypothetical protein
MANDIFPMATSNSCDSVSLESSAFSVSSELCPSQDHDRPGCVQTLSVVFDPGVNKIWDCPISEGKLKEYMRDLRKSLDEIHKKSNLR